MMPSVLILGFGIVCALVALGLTLAFYGMYKNAKKGREGFAQAVPATAKVLKVGQSSASQSYGGIGVELTLEVMPTDGRPYRADVNWSVEPARLEEVQKGCSVASKIDPHNRKTIYSAEPWAQSLDVEQDPTDDSED